MLRAISILCTVLGTFAGFAAAQGLVRVEPPNLQGSRPLQEQTAAAAVRDYLESWSTMKAALEQNRADLLSRDFVGNAMDKLTDAIQRQSKLGIRTVYQDSSHDLQIVFYSPDGLSIELIDKVDYDMQLLVHEKVETTQRQQARYIVVLTPSEVRWRVRVFQAVHEE
jgi:urocanate hydratase